MQLSDEQSKFVEIAQNGKNILVDACIGSGKTTAIQALCKKLPKEKEILYLTYNKLLKLDEDKGARNILKKEKTNTIKLSKKYSIDIDTKEDVEKFLNLQE